MKLVITRVEREEKSPHIVNRCADIMDKDTKIGYIEVYEVLNEDNEIEYAYIKSIDIDESYRNQGRGAKVLKDLANLYGTIFICPDNENAARLYKRIGEEVNRPPKEIECELDNWGEMYKIY